MSSPTLSFRANSAYYLILVLIISTPFLSIQMGVQGHNESDSVIRVSRLTNLQMIYPIYMKELLNGLG